MTDDAKTPAPADPSKDDLSAVGQDRTQLSVQEPPRRRRRWGRMLLRLLLLIAIPAAALAGGAYWYEVTGRWVSTENAYVKSHIIAVSPNLDGRVIAVHVAENQKVAKGALLFELNPEPHWVRMRMAEAKREMVRHEVLATRAEFNQVNAEIAEAQERVRYFEHEAERQRALANKAITTRSKLDEAEFNLSASRQRLNALRQKVRQTLAMLGGDPDRDVELHPMYLEAQAEIDEAEMHLSYTQIRAPIDGIVTRLRLESGEYVEEGEPAFGLIATDEVWIEANLKETQLTHVREGQYVTVELDAYPDVVWTATVDSISPATGAEFSVLPPQNASGNWVKVVQRLPVRIKIEQRPDQPPLRAGMTATIAVDTGHQRHLLTTVKEAFAKLREDMDGTAMSAQPTSSTKN